MYGGTAFSMPAAGGGVTGLTELKNATADELITVGGTVTELEAETNLTFANDQLKLPVYDVDAPALISASGATTIGIAFDNNGFHLVHAGGSKLFFRRDGIYMGTQKISFGSNTGGTDSTLIRDDADVVALKNATSDQEFRIYNIDSGSNDEFASLGWANSANVFTIETEKTGTGTDRAINLKAATGFVGINTPHPAAAYTLDVNGNIHTDEHVYFDGTACRLKRNGNFLYVQGTSGIQFATNSEQYHMLMDVGGDLLVGSTGSSDTVEDTAKLELKSTTKGFLPPRMDATAREAISSPAEGLMIYNTDDNQLEFYNGSDWMECSNVAA